MLFTLKLARLLPNDRNRPNVFIKRTEYAEWLINHAILRNRVFIDACGCDVWTARSHERASIDERAYQQVCENKTWLIVWQYLKIVARCFTQPYLEEGIVIASLLFWSRHALIWIMIWKLSSYLTAPQHIPIHLSPFPLRDFWAHLFLDAVQGNINTITAAKWGKWYRFMQTYVYTLHGLNNEAIRISGYSISCTVFHIFCVLHISWFWNS